MKTQLYTQKKVYIVSKVLEGHILLCYEEIVNLSAIKYSDQVTTLTYALMDKFCHCFIMLFLPITLL